VNEIFGTRRSRAHFDWWYRRNPRGTARCWLVRERDTGRLVSSSCHLPWPLARGDTALWGLQLCDVAVVPDLQRLGVTQMRREAQAVHPHYANEYRIGWPNVKSVGLKRKHGHDDETLGPLREGFFPLAPAHSSLRRVLERIGRASRRLVQGDPAVGGLRVEAVERFDSSIDGATLRCRVWPHFWCPHDSDFLNWRYLEHPSESHLALAVYEGRDPLGYCVIRILDSRALLMEFTAPPGEAAARLLLHAAKEAAARAGCHRLAFFSAPGWPHWHGFRESGFLEGRGDRRFMVIDPEPHEARALERWQLVPGDQDAP
jgi:hypothetical protein